MGGSAWLCPWAKGRGQCAGAGFISPGQGAPPCSAPPKPHTGTREAAGSCPLPCTCHGLKACKRAMQHSSGNSLWQGNRCLTRCCCLKTLGKSCASIKQWQKCIATHGWWLGWRDAAWLCVRAVAGSSPCCAGGCAGNAGHVGANGLTNAGRGAAASPRQRVLGLPGIPS